MVLFGGVRKGFTNIKSHVSSSSETYESLMRVSRSVRDFREFSAKEAAARKTLEGRHASLDQLSKPAGWFKVSLWFARKIWLERSKALASFNAEQYAKAKEKAASDISLIVKNAEDSLKGLAVATARGRAPPSQAERSYLTHISKLNYALQLFSPQNPLMPVLSRLSHLVDVGYRDRIDHEVSYSPPHGVADSISADNYRWNSKRNFGSYASAEYRSLLENLHSHLGNEFLRLAEPDVAKHSGRPEDWIAEKSAAMESHWKEKLANLGKKRHRKRQAAVGAKTAS